MGYLTMAHGLACDKLVSMLMVDARGRLVRADQRRNAGLLAASCGGGGGNFGAQGWGQYAGAGWGWGARGGGGVGVLLLLYFCIRCSAKRVLPPPIARLACSPPRCTPPLLRPGC